jgi:hypothetical protein
VLPYNLKGAGDESFESLFFETKTFCLQRNRNGMVGEDYSSNSLLVVGLLFLQNLQSEIKNMR